MKTALSFVAGALLVLLLQQFFHPLRPAPVGQPIDSVDSVTPRIDALEARIDRLQRELEFARAASARQVVPAPTPQPAAGGQPGTAAPPVGGLDSARRYLQLYVASFEREPDGSEFFRLAVEGLAAELVEEIAALVRDGERPFALRKRLIAILGQSAFRGDPRVRGALLDVTRVGPGAISVVALHALRRVGTEADVGALEASFAGLDPPGRAAALACLVELAGASANASLLRLLRGATDPEVRAQILAHVRPDDVEGALAVLREGFGGDVPERLAAAHRLAGMHGAPFVALVESQLAVERDDRVRAALTRSRSALSRLPNHHPLQATGQPNSDAQVDSVTAWATAQPNAGIEWLEVGFDRPMRGATLHIHEVLAPGAVVEVRGVAVDGRVHTLWRGTDPTRVPGVFSVPLQPIASPLRRVRIVLDTRLRDGWNEIDAVQLVGPDGSSWATTATASSYYGAGQRGFRSR
ncbi:MAG: hypothetical protein KDC87_13895 [Planctomycetes bacterium]|nr:hypothetical protein [Planctomycetota bacterium]MCB9870604.1 hypothetical protein [Planctomycetota bacterium]MCB9889471.1 hypothetical protein [Planctomycetota bacterium]